MSRRPQTNTHAVASSPCIWSFPAAIFSKLPALIWHIIRSIIVFVISACEFGISLVVLFMVDMGLAVILREFAGLEINPGDREPDPKLIVLYLIQMLLHALAQFYMALDSEYSLMPFYWRLTSSLLGLTAATLGLAVLTILVAMAGRWCGIKIPRFDSKTVALDSTDGAGTVSSPSEQIEMEEGQRKGPNEPVRVSA